MADKLKKAATVGAGDKWHGASVAERQAWLKASGHPASWCNTTFEELPEDVQGALAAKA